MRLYTGELAGKAQADCKSNCLENGLLFDVFPVAHGHCPTDRCVKKGVELNEILSVLMHDGLHYPEFKKQKTALKFFDDDVGSFPESIAWRRR